MAKRSRHSHRSIASTRYFEKGEKVLCYEPDPTKAKVLYDSKILGIYDTKDKRGRKLIQYKVHFQGWSSSWDRKVNADFVLKDTEENRQLQRDLAEKAQLQINAFLYRKERSINKKKQNKSVVPSDDATTAATGGNTTNADLQPSPQFRTRGSSEDNFSSSSTLERQEDCSMKDECDSESCCSSVESFPEEERVLLRISERLRQYLEYDHDMIVKYCKQHALPARIPVVAILENFVKHSVIKLVFSTTQVESTRRRTTQQRTNKKEHEFDKLVATVGLLKEVADGLRIYFDFTIAEYLLYKEEKEYALSYLTEESLKNFTYVALPGLTPVFLNPTKNESDASSVVENCTETSATETASTTPAPSEEPQKRRSRLHRSDDCEMTLESCLDNCLSSIASTSSGASTPLHSAVSGSCGPSGINCLKSLQPMALNIPTQTKEFLQSVLSWHLLPTNAPAAPSMIFGAPHLARLIVKLPEFLNASSMNDDKLKVLLQHLDTFVNYLEARKEWFNEDNYARSNTTRKRANSNENVKPNISAESLKSTLESNTSMQAGNATEEIKTASTPTATTTATTATAKAAAIAT